MRWGPGEIAALSRSDYTCLFGLNDAAKGRLMNVARLHNCSTVWAGETLVFRKRPPTWDGLADRSRTN